MTNNEFLKKIKEEFKEQSIILTASRLIEDIDESKVIINQLRNDIEFQLIHTDNIINMYKKEFREIDKSCFDKIKAKDFYISLLLNQIEDLKKGQSLLIKSSEDYIEDISKRNCSNCFYSRDTDTNGNKLRSELFCVHFARCHNDTFCCNEWSTC